VKKVSDQYMLQAYNFSMDTTVLAMRSFNRWYTRKLGLLDEKLVGTEFTLTQNRVMFELAHRPELTARGLVAELNLNQGYLSRVISGLRSKGVINVRVSPLDRRERLLSLTSAGHELFKSLDSSASEQVAGLVNHLAKGQKSDLDRLFAGIRVLLEPPPTDPDSVTVRPAEPGDMGWILERHATVFAVEDNFGPAFEALVAGIIAGYLKERDLEREFCWIAERQGVRLGSVFLMKDPDGAARLRLLFVDPAARGLGVGARLVATCVERARNSGYSLLRLWTQADLPLARRIYATQGFQIVETAEHSLFGRPQIGETWELALK
jgi:DNA-binding MarR family transcriptional regulator/GNAT superfamily N-acetyltransferase